MFLPRVPHLPQPCLELLHVILLQDDQRVVCCGYWKPLGWFIYATALLLLFLLLHPAASSCCGEHGKKQYLLVVVGPVGGGGAVLCVQDSDLRAQICESLEMIARQSAVKI